MKGFILLFLATILVVTIGSVGFLYSFLRRLLTGGLEAYFYGLAITLDQSGNVLVADLFDLIMIKSDGYKFGDPDETISSVVGKNLERGTLTRVGKMLNNILEKLDPGHSINAIEINP